MPALAALGQEGAVGKVTKKIKDVEIAGFTEGLS